MPQLNRLVKKTHDRVANLVQLLEKLSFVSERCMIKNDPLEQQKIYRALCQAIQKLGALSNAVPIEALSFLEPPGAEEEEERLPVRFI
jgi:hypothetical protein